MQKKQLTKALAVVLTASMLMQNMPISVFADSTTETISASSAGVSSEEAHSAEDTVAADEKEAVKSDEDVGETGEAETNAETEETGADGGSGSTEKTGTEETTAPIEETDAEKVDVKTKENSVAGGVNTSADTSVKKDDSTSNETSEDGSKTHGEAEEVKEDSVEAEERKASDSELSKDGLSLDVRKRFSPAGAFEADITETKLHVNAAYDDDVFPAGTRMVVNAITGETKLKEAGEKAVADAKEADDKDLTVTSVLGVDISFYAPNDEGKEEKVQPADGKDVTITLTMPEDKAEASEETTASEDGTDKTDAQNSTVVKVIHVEDENNPVVLSDVQENGQNVTFTSGSFSPFYVVQLASKKVEQKDFVFKTYWKNSVENNADKTPRFAYTNEDFDENDPETQKDLQFRPDTNNLVNTTVQLSLALKGDENVHYPAESIKIDVPESYYEGWDDNDIHRVAVNDDLKRLDPLYWMIPKAPKTNTLSDFNYTVITKAVNGKEETYYELTNHKDLTGGTVFDTEIAYRLRPTMLKVENTATADGTHVGHYSKELPISVSIDQAGADPVSKENTLSVDVQTKVNPTKLTMGPSKADPNNGIFFNWDSAWGQKPEKADQYFYIVWYLDLRRGAGSTQPFDYVLNLDKEKTQGGELIGVKKYTIGNEEAYEQPEHIFRHMDKSYTGLYGDGDTSAIGKTWPGIMDNPVDNTIYNLDFCTSRTENLRSNWLDQVYCLLFRYPISKVQEATDKGIKVAEDGFQVLNDGISITEYWRDGHTVTHPAAKVDGAQVKTMPILGGGPGSVKQVVDANPRQSRTIVGLQSIIADGLNDALLIPKNYHWSFALNADSVASTCTWDTEKGTYTANGNSVEILDRPLTLFTDINNKGYAIYKSPEDDISKANPLSLTDDDYRYTSFYITGAGEYDISYNSKLGWQRNPRANTNYKSYEPYEIWTRAAHSDEWTHFGDVKINEHQQYVFTNSETQTSQIVSSNARVDFPADTVQIYTKHNSKFYESQFSLIYNLQLKATPQVINRLKEDMKSGQATYVGSFADKVHKSGDNMKRNGVIGQYWNQVAYRMDALSSKVYLYKERSNLKNDSTKSEETYDISVHFYNDCHSSNEFATAKYMKPYMFTSGVFYDLLPAGTYVKADEITLGTREGPGTTISKEKISSYTLEMFDNWENSGQTMMKITFSVPNDETHRTWHDYWYGARLNYKLHNSYTNITDRGTNVVNTVAFVNTSGNDVIFNTNVNKDNIDTANFDKKEYFTELVKKENKRNNEVALAQATLVYDPVTVLQAAFTNRAESDTNPSYEQDNTAYLGDKYSYRLQYTAASDTRTDNMVIYDVLDGDENKKIGDVSWIDVSSIEAKRSYDALNPNTTDTCKPVVYYATVVPTNAQKNIDDYKNIWVTQAPVDKSKIKAIAIDCRKTDKDKNFVLDKKGTLVAYVHCTASSQKDWAERVNTNDATLSARLFNGDTAGAAETKMIDVKSTLHLIAPNLEIHKASDHGIGTKASPSEIGNGPDTALTYTLTIENKADASYPGISNVVVHDTLPKGLTLIGTDSTDRMKSITVRSNVLGLDTAKPITDTSIKPEVSGYDLNFTLPQFTRGEIEISIPVIRKGGIHESTRYENTAEIVKAGNVVYDNSDDDHQKIHSNTTYHKSSAHTLTIKPNGGSWNSSTADSVFPLYDSETMEIPVPTREGYTFAGWTIESGNGKLQSTTDTSTSGTRALPAVDQTMLFTMADTDTMLQANWTINWYPVTVTKTFRGIDALPSNFAIVNTYEATKFTTANATSGNGSAANPYTWTISVPYHMNITFTETGYDASGYSVTTSAHTANATGSRTAASGTITVPANDNASVSFDNVYSHTSYEVTKTWAGPEKYLKQSIPEQLIVELYKDGAKVANADKTLSAGNQWSATWDTLPDKNPDGSKIQYSVKEILNDQRFAQETPVVSTSETGTKASITNTLKTVDVTAVKTWKDQNNKFETRPENINIHLYQNGVPIGEDAAIVNADGTWTHTFEDVPKCDAHGQDYVYTVKEDSVNGYNTSYEGMTIINTLITTDVTVQVSWKDFDDQWKLRPETVHITLLKNGKPFNGSKIDLSDEDDWTHVFTDLPLEDADGKAYRYTVTEDDVHAYDKKIDDTQKTLLTITNTLKTRDITATKNWVDDDNKKKTRPDSITLRLTQREKEASASELSPASDEIWATASEISPASDGSWTTSFDHLPVEDKKGHRYCYDVSEDAVTGYTSSIAANSDHSHYTVTNTICTPVVSDPTIKKVIEGDTPSENATFQFTLKALRQLTADGKEIPGAELPMPEGADGQVKTVTVQGAGEYAFGNIEFSMPGTYIYQMSEVDTKVERYTYDTSVYIVTYKVTQNDDHLDVVRTITKDGAEAETTQFTNMYKKPSGSSGGGSHVGSGPKPSNEPGPTGGPDDTTISTPTPDEGRVLGASRGPAPVQNGGRVLGASRNAGTGDMSLMLVWFVLMLAALGLLAGYVIYIRKHRRNRT